MSVFINQNTTFIIQGITGKEGRRALKFMQTIGAKVIGGVRKGKAGEVIDGVKVFDSVAEIKADASVICVPSNNVKDAMIEAINEGIKLLVVITDKVAIQDIFYCYELAKQNNVKIIGPSTAGIIVPGIVKAGLIGGDDNKSFLPGSVGVISKSGGMLSETARLLTSTGIGQSTCINIGGDKFVGTDIVDCLKEFRQDDQTKLVVIFGEIGGGYEEAAAEYIKESGFEKPVVAYIAGKETYRYREVSLGHAGAIISGNTGGWESKVNSLRDAGVTVVDLHHDIVKAVKDKL